MKSTGTTSAGVRAHIGLRVRELRRQLDFSQTTFATHLDITQSSLSQIENGHHFPSFDALTLLVSQFNVDSNWVLTGSGSPFIGQQQSLEHGYMYGIQEKALAGYSAKHRDELWLAANQRYRLPGYEESDGLRIFQVLHDSMEPTLYDQDHLVAALLVDAIELHVGQVVIAVTNDEVIVKRLAGYEPNLERLTLASDNPKYKAIELSRADCKELWLVSARLTRQLSPLIANQDYRIRQLEAAYQELSEKIEKLDT